MLVYRPNLGRLGADSGQVLTTVSTAGAATTSILPAVGATAAVPIVGAAVAGVTLALGLIFARKGPKQKVISTQIVNELEPLLQQNLEGYLLGPRTPSSKAAALQNFDQAFDYLQSNQACGSPDLGNPGKACIADRGRGGKWDWYAMYRDPIANDPATGSKFAAMTGGTSPALLAAAALLIVGVML